MHVHYRTAHQGWRWVCTRSVKMTAGMLLSVFWIVICMLPTLNGCNVYEERHLLWLLNYTLVLLWLNDPLWQVYADCIHHPLTATCVSCCFSLLADVFKQNTEMHRVVHVAVTVKQALGSLFLLHQMIWGFLTCAYTPPSSVRMEVLIFGSNSRLLLSSQPLWWIKKRCWRGTN